MKRKIILLQDIKHSKGNLKHNDIGEAAFGCESNGKIPVWFVKHRREFYWFPIWLKKEQVEILEK